MNKVKLKVTYLLEGKSIIRDELYDEETLTKWITHQYEQMSSNYLNWEVVQLGEEI